MIKFTDVMKLFKEEKSMNIHEVRVAKVACCGGEVMVGEVTFEFMGHTMYATAQEYDTTQLTVSADSVYDFLTDRTDLPAERMKLEFSTWEEAERAEAPNFAADAFKVLERVMNAFAMEERDA